MYNNQEHKSKVNAVGRFKMDKLNAFFVGQTVSKEKEI